MFCDVTVCVRFMSVVVKTMHAASMHNVLPAFCPVLFEYALTFRDHDNTKANVVLTFDFKDTDVRCVVCDTIDYRISFWCKTLLINQAF